LFLGHDNIILSLADHSYTQAVTIVWSKIALNLLCAIKDELHLAGNPAIDPHGNRAHESVW